jgi:hypothetical protein
MPDQMQEAFDGLKVVLARHASQLLVEVESAREFTLNTPYSERWKRPLLFGSVQRKKNYVAFYLMPVYMFPDLLVGVSPALRKRMQGKSCFNFKAHDEGLFEELAHLTQRSIARMTAEGYVG